MDNPFNSKVPPADQVSEALLIHHIDCVFGGYGCESIYDGYDCGESVNR